VRRASLLIPCWNALALTRVCLERALRLAGGPLEVIAVDNGSDDGTRRWLSGLSRRAARLAPGARVAVIANRRNRGYPAAMNQALAAARGEFVVFGNADAAPTRDWLPGMLAAFEAAPRAAVVSPCSNPPAKRAPLWSAPPHYAGLAGLDRFAAAARLAADPGPFFPAPGFIPGFWMMARRARVLEAGGFDERFTPGGFEDFDLQWRLKEDGGVLGFAGRAFVHHEWFGIARANGLRQDRLYGPARRRRLTEKFPATARVEMSVRTFFDR
jgi:GT2 family glycosyltransferase